jgi:protoporphyrinogen oxidase
VTVYVLGAGPAGLAVVDGLADAGRSDFVVVERADHLGGLAATHRWAGHGDHDLGPHKVFTTDAALQARVEALLGPEDWITRQKSSRIWINGHYLRYPPAAADLVRAFGAPRFVRMGMGYAAAALVPGRRSAEHASFEADLRSRVGSPLYEAMFRPVAEKLWGDPANLDARLSRARVQTPPLGEAVRSALGRKSETSSFEALTFRYPRGGLSRLWEAIRRKGVEGHWLLETRVVGLEVQDGRITQIRMERDGAEESVEVTPDDTVISSMPLGPTAMMLAGHLGPDRLDQIRSQVVLNDLLLVFFHLDTPRLMEDSWIFVPDLSVAFHRISEQESFDPGMTPAGTIVCCEVMSSPSRPNAQKTDEQLAAECRAGMERLFGAVPAEKGMRVIRLPRSYPVYKVGHEPVLAAALVCLDEITNFRSIGRQGAYNYIGTLDAMDIGYGCAAWLNAGGAPERERAWEAERERTTHYPVLD